MNNHVTYPVVFLNEFIDYQNPYDLKKKILRS